MNVLSLFDGMSCGQIALNKIGVKYENYFASEIKKHAIEVTQYNYPKTIQLGDVTKIKSNELPKINLLIGGSPCQDFSSLNNTRNGLKGSKSSLFFEYLRLLKECQPDFFLLENVIMPKSDYNIISNYLGCKPVRINASNVSAVLRDRYYWTNIGLQYVDLFNFSTCIIPQPIDKKIYLNDILEYGFSNRKKHSCLLVNCGENPNRNYLLRRNKSMPGTITLIYSDKKMEESTIRMATQLELERLHTIPEGYTNILNKRKAGDLIGDGWVIDVILMEKGG